MAPSMVSHGCATLSYSNCSCRIWSSPAELLAGHCQVGRGSGLSWNGLRISQLRATGLFAGGTPEGTGEGWCGLCGDRGGWCTCGRCMGEGGFPTRPGLAGVKGKVGWARCKTCFGQTLVPCLFCGVSDATEWKAWIEQAKRRPHRNRKQSKTYVLELNSKAQM